MSILSATVVGSGLNLRDILSDIPHDGPAIVVYGLLLLFVGFIWWGSRGRGGTEARGPDAPRAEPPRHSLEERRRSSG